MRGQVLRPGAPRAPIPPDARRLLDPLAETARRRGTPLYAVGGCVRDWLLGRRGFDLDVAVAGDPDPVAERAAELLGGRAEPFGRFGTRRVIGSGKFRIDVACTRSESYPEPAGLPVVDEVGVPIEKDLFRRDFTVNALAARLDDGSRELIDPYRGAADLGRRALRVLHPASFRDDPTRVFRAARFVGRLRLRPAPGLIKQAREALRAGHAARLSPHRRLHELLRLLEEKDPGPAFRLLRDWGYLALLQPKLAWPKRMPGGVEPRLAALALELGAKEGRAFLDAFPLEHQQRSRLAEAIGLAFSNKAPRVPPSPLALAAARRACPKLAPAALKPCFLAGDDLIAADFKPGPEFHKILDEAARLQRAGRLKSRAAALAWLKTLRGQA